MFVSEALAVAAAGCMALSSMLIGELRGRLDVFRLARWQMVAATLMTGAVSLALGGWRTLTPHTVGLLAGSSFFAIILSMTCYYATIYLAGPRVNALLFSLTSPFAVLLGYLVLGETIRLQQGLGIALVLTGLVLAIGLPLGGGQAGASGPRVTWHGIALGTMSALGLAVGNLFARPAMAAGAEPFTAMAVRAGIAAVFFVVLPVLPLRVLHRPYRFAWRDFGFAVGSAAIGTGLGISLMLAALAQGKVGIVSTLSSMTPVLVLPMIWIRTGTRPSRRAWIGAALAVGGTAAISL